MITLEQIKGKSSLELIKLLIQQMTHGDMRQTDLFKQLVKANLLKREKNELELLLQDFVKEVKRGSEENNSDAICLYGYINLEGIGLPQNVQQAKELFEQAKALTHPHSVFLLASMYERGLGLVEKDYVQAIALYREAVVLGDPAAMVHLASMYHMSRGVARDDHEATRLLEQAIVLGDARAMKNFGLIYQYDKGVTQNTAQAIRLLKQAVELGDTSAMVHLAVIYEWLGFIEKNFVQAIELLKQAVELGDASAMVHLASMYDMSRGVDRDDRESTRLLEQAVALGNTTAMHNLAITFSTIDHSKAARLFRQAVKGGSQQSKQYLRDRNEIYDYHYYMLTNQIEGAVKLLVTHRNLVNEVIEYDLIPALLNPNTLMGINDVLTTNKEQAVYQGLILDLLTACQHWERNNPQPLIKERAIFQVNCLKALNIDKLNQDKLVLISDTIIDLWYLLDGFTDDATNLLTQVLLKVERQPIPLEQCYLRNMAVILIKKLYGEEYKVSLEEWRVEQVRLLTGFIKDSKKPTREEMSQYFGARLIPCSIETVLDQNPQNSGATDFGFFGGSSDFGAAGAPLNKRSCLSIK